MSDRVRVTIDGGVADVRLNRPDKLNALDGAMFLAIAAAGEQLKVDPSVRAVVLSGEGRGFCAGLDLDFFQQMATGAIDDAAGNPGRMYDSGLTHLGQQTAWVWQELTVPVIAAVHGVALGGGLQVALGADLRIVAPDARLSVMEIRWGLVPDMTGSYQLGRLVRPDVAKELCLTGRMVNGEEAVRIGLATRVSADPRGDALALAHDIAGRNPDAVRGIKTLIDGAAGREPVAQFAEERRVVAALIGSANQIEAVTAHFEQRAPVYH